MCYYMSLLKSYNRKRWNVRGIWGHGWSRIHRMAVKTERRNPLGARGKDCRMVHFFDKWLCAERERHCLWAYSNLGTPVLHRNFLFFFLIDNSSHLNCIFSFKANTAFPCNKPNKIKYQEETYWRKTKPKKIVGIVYFSLFQALSAEEHCHCNFLNSWNMLFNGKQNVLLKICK